MRLADPAHFAALAIYGATALFTSANAATSQSPTHFDITLEAGAATIRPHPTAPGTVTVMETVTAGQGRRTDTRAGLPDMSIRQVELLLPYDADLGSIQLELLQEQVETVGLYDVAPAPVAAAHLLTDVAVTVARPPEGVQLDDHGRDSTIYGANLAHPLQAVEIASVGEQRAARVLQLAFHPFRWNPATRLLCRIDRLELRVRWDRRTVRSMTRSIELGDPQLPGVIAARKAAGLKILSDVDLSYQHVTRPVETDYLIVTTEDVIRHSLQLDPFVAMKRAQGFQVGVRSVEWVQASYPTASVQASLRSYLRVRSCHRRNRSRWRTTDSGCSSGIERRSRRGSGGIRHRAHSRPSSRSRRIGPPPGHTRTVDPRT